jgi:hypothetical protein
VGHIIKIKPFREELILSLSNYIAKVFLKFVGEFKDNG